MTANESKGAAVGVGSVGCEVLGADEWWIAQMRPLCRATTACQPRVMATGRALSDGEKQAVVERILAAWVKVPDLRLGQFIECANRSRELGDVFVVEDVELAEACERYAAKVCSP